MAFNNKQLLAVGAIVGGIVLLPVAFAMKDDIKSSNNRSLVQERQAQPTNHQSNANGTPTCEYYGVAGNAGFYHFKFPEASSSDLVTVNGYKVHQMAAGDLKRMIADARSQGVTLTIGSAFRSVDYQRGIVQDRKSVV